MIQLNDLSKELTEVPNDELGSIHGGGAFGQNLPQLSKQDRFTVYNTPLIVPMLPSSSPSIQAAISNVGFKAGDGKGNVIEVGRGFVSWENHGTGLGVSWNQDAVGIVAKLSF
jgi:hypothetical protein